MSKGVISSVERQSLVGLAFILLFSLLLKFIVLFRTPVINNDATLYIELAREIASAGKIFYNRPPLLPLMIALFHTVIHDWIWAAHFVMLFFLVFLVVPVYGIAKYLWGIRGALWTSVFVAVSPFFNKYAGDVIKGPLFWAFGLLFVYFLLRYLDTGKAKFLTVVLLTFLLSILSRREAILLPIPAGLLIIKQWAKGKVTISKLFFSLAIYLIVITLVLSTFFLYCYSKNTSKRVILKRWWQYVNYQVHFFLPVANYKLLSNKLRSIEKTIPGQGKSYNFSEIARHYILLVYGIGYVELLARLVFPLFFLLAFLGIFVVWKKGFTKYHQVVFFFLVVYVILGFLYLNARNWVDSRYVMFPALLFHFWVWPGFEKILEHIKNLKIRGREMMSIFMILVVCIPLLKTVTVKRGSERILKDAGVWIKVNGKTKGIILCSDYRIAFYAERKGVRLSKKYEDKEVDFGFKARKINAAYIALVVKRGKKVPSQTGYRPVIQFVGDRKTICLFERIEKPNRTSF